MRVFIAVMLVVSAVVGCSSQDIWNQVQTAVAEDRDAVSYCRSAFPDAARTPGAPGGWILEPDLGRLCVYGSLEGQDTEELEAKLRQPQTSVRLMVVRSSGGPVDPWLAIAEAMGQRKPVLIVDEACYSSCANYAVPVSSQLRFSGDALVVWHGGPTGLLTATHLGMAVDEYAALASRTDRLYDAHGISPYLLADTAQPPSSAQMITAGRNVAGYAVSPTRLNVCYRLGQMSRVRQPSSDADVLTASLRRGLVFLEFPKTSTWCQADGS